MKKIISISMALIVSCLLATAFAADFSQDGNTGEVTVLAQANTDATVDVTFQPSNSVIMTGASEATAFALGASHTAVENRASGKQFAMASDASVVFFIDISDDGIGAPIDLAGDTNRADIFATDSANWHTM